MTLHSKRQRARRLNSDDPDADPVEKNADSSDVDADDLSLDYSGVVSKAEDDEAKSERREQLVKGLGGSGDGISFEKVWKGDRETPDIDYSYDGITKSSEEKEREKQAAVIGEAVASALEQRGISAEEDADAGTAKAAESESESESGDGDDAPDVVEKADRTARLVEEFRDGVENRQRVASFKQLQKEFEDDGGDPATASVAEFLDWYNEGNPEATVRVEDGSVTVEEPA